MSSRKKIRLLLENNDVAPIKIITDVSYLKELDEFTDEKYQF